MHSSLSSYSHISCGSRERCWSKLPRIDRYLSVYLRRQPGQRSTIADCGLITSRPQWVYTGQSAAAYHTLQVPEALHLSAPDIGWCHRCPNISLLVGSRSWAAGWLFEGDVLDQYYTNTIVYYRDLWHYFMVTSGIKVTPNISTKIKDVAVAPPPPPPPPPPVPCNNPLTRVLEIRQPL